MHSKQKKLKYKKNHLVTCMFNKYTKVSFVIIPLKMANTFGNVSQVKKLTDNKF